jgi:hypothetical protein
MRSGGAGLGASAALLTGLLVGGWAGAADADIVRFAGDWGGDAVDTIGTFDPASDEWTLWSTNFETALAVSFASGAGVPGAVPVVGDWDGDGVDTVGLYRTALWFLRNSNSAGRPDAKFVFFQGPPIVGDWRGSGVETIGTFYRGGLLWLMRAFNSQGPATERFVFPSGVAIQDLPTAVAMAGDWDGDGIDTPGLFEAPTWRLRNSNTEGPADVTFDFDPLAP